MTPAGATDVTDLAPPFAIDDALWAELEPLMPSRRRRHRYTGRKPIPDRAALNGILHVLATGIAWDRLPQEYGYGSGVTCWRRLRDWQRTAAWETVRRRLVSELTTAGQIDWTRASPATGPHARGQRSRSSASLAR